MLLSFMAVFPQRLRGNQAADAGEMMLDSELTGAVSTQDSSMPWTCWQWMSLMFILSSQAWAAIPRHRLVTESPGLRQCSFVGHICAKHS